MINSGTVNKLLFHLYGKTQNMAYFRVYSRAHAGDVSNLEPAQTKQIGTKQKEFITTLVCTLKTRFKAEPYPETPTINQQYLLHHSAPSTILCCQEALTEPVWCSVQRST